MGLREKVMENKNNIEDIEQEVTVNVDGEMVDVLVRPMSLKEQNKAEMLVQNNPDLPRSVPYIVFCVYEPDGSERVFDYPDDIDEIADMRNKNWLTELIGPCLEVNGAQVSDEDLKKTTT